MSYLGSSKTLGRVFLSPKRSNGNDVYAVRAFIRDFSHSREDGKKRGGLRSPHFVAEQFIPHAQQAAGALLDFSLAELDLECSPCSIRKLNNGIDFKV